MNCSSFSLFLRLKINGLNGPFQLNGGDGLFIRLLCDLQFVGFESTLLNRRGLNLFQPNFL